MKGLLRKDLYTLGKQMKLFVLMIALMAVVPGGMMYPFAIIYAGMLPYTALAYDERSRWTEFARMLPYTPRQLVRSKYVLGWLAIAAACVLSAGGMALTALLDESGNFSDLVMLPVLAGMSLFLMGVTLPLMFRFGVEKGRMLLLGAIVLTGAAAMGLAQLNLSSGLGDVLLTGTAGVIVAVPVLGFVLQPLSIWLSGRLLSRQKG